MKLFRFENAASVPPLFSQPTIISRRRFYFMALNVILPHGKSADLDGTTVIRSVDQKESDGYNDRITADLAKRPDYTGIVASRRWTLAYEQPNADGRVVTRYTSDLSPQQLVNAAPELKARFDLVDGGRSAIAKGAKVHLIRPLEQRDGSANQAVIYVEGGSSSGLLVTQMASEAHTALGLKAAHLTKIGDEGFIDRRRIERVGQFDPDKDLQPGQKRFAIAVNFKGVYRPQYFAASEADLRGAPVIDIRASAGASAGASAAVRPGQPAPKPASAKPGVR
jgi:hypothetical protein